MKICILALAEREGGGVYQYTLTLIDSLINFSSINARFYIVTTNEVAHEIEKTIQNKDNHEIIKVVPTKSGKILKIKRLLYLFAGIKIGDLVGTYKFIKDLECDIIISTIISPLPYYIGKKYVITIHDFQQNYYPEFFTFKERIWRSIVYPTGKYARIVICESDCVKNDIMKFLKVEEKKIRVIPSPPPRYICKAIIEKDKLFEIKEKYKLPNKYLFYPAQFWYHKNHIRLLQAIVLLRKKYNENISLVLVGSPKNNFDNVMNEIKNLKLGNDIRWLGYIPEEDMPYLYKLSTAIVIPTLFESVSMPIYESFYLGCPVVSSNVCALPEQVGNAGLLFDPNNVEDMAEKIYHVLANENLRQELVKKGHERIKNLTLEKYAKQWEEVIKEVLNISK